MRIRRAANLLRPGDNYRSAVFSAGLARHGFTVEPKWEKIPEPGDLLLIWNRCRGFETVAETYERRGAQVLIAENGYTPKLGGGKYYALADGHHNGAGRWFVGDRPRHPIPHEPWRRSGGHILILPQRGIGERGVAMPLTWGRAVQDRIQPFTDRPIIVRPHPGHHQKPDTLLDALCDAHCAVTWGSGAGIRALQTGIPVFHEFSRWIGAPGAARLDRQLEDCHIPDRELLWTRISWAQWTLEEIGTGEAFDALLNARGSLFFAGQQSLENGRARDGSGDRAEGDRAQPPLVAQLSG